MNLNKKDMKNLMLLILFAVVVYVGIQKADVLLVFLRFLIGIAYPFLLGAAFAFVLNVPMSFMEKKLFGSAESKGKMKKLGRPLSLILSLILVVGIVLVVILVVVPEMGQTFMSVSASIEAAIPRLQTWAVDTFHDNKQIAEWIQNLEFDWNSIIGAAVDFLKNGAGNVLNSTVAMARTVVNVLMNFFYRSCICRLYSFAEGEAGSSDPKSFLCVSVGKTGEESIGCMFSQLQDLCQFCYRAVPGGCDPGNYVFRIHDTAPVPVCHADRDTDRVYGSDPYFRGFHRLCCGDFFDPGGGPHEGACLYCVVSGTAAG